MQSARALVVPSLVYAMLRVACSMAWAQGHRSTGANDKRGFVTLVTNKTRVASSIEQSFASVRDTPTWLASW